MTTLFPLTEFDKKQDFTREALLFLSAKNAVISSKRNIRRLYIKMIFDLI